MQHSKQFLDLVDQAKQAVVEITPIAVKDKMDRKENFYLIDVREDHEWNYGTIEGALHLSKGIIESHIEKEIPNKNAEIVVYCRGGFRGVLAAENLQRMGYHDVKNMTGGIRAWKQAGLPGGDVFEE